MTSQDSIEVKSDNSQISQEDEEDKKFASQAVAFVIGHTGHARNGVVSLCASVAALLKEKAKLKQEVEHLQQEVFLLKQNTVKIQGHPVNFLKKETSIPLRSESAKKTEFFSHLDKHLPDTSKSVLDINPLTKPFYKKLNGCICKQCIESKSRKLVTPPLNKGVKVIIQGDMIGVVQYIGHLESLQFPEIFVGVELSKPVGNSDGTLGNKCYFSVPKNYGIFVPLCNILCVVKEKSKP